MIDEPIETSLPCCITGDRDARIVASRDRHGNPLRTVISTASGLVYTDPRPTPEEVRHFYAEEYRKDYKNVVVPKKKHILRAGRIAKSRLDQISEYLPSDAKLLDAGSGGGEFVYLANARGYAAEGIEPNEGYAQFSINEYQVPVFNGFYQDATFEPESFDAITLWHVLEHLEEPVESLALLAKFLKPGGHFVIEVPNVEHTATAPNQKWHVGHLFNFSPQTLTAAAATAGLQRVYCQTPGDGGVIFMVLRKPETAWQPDIAGLVHGSFEQTAAILQGHTMFKHYLKIGTPLGRLVRKVNRGREEVRTLEELSDSRPVAILDSLRAA